MKNTNNEETKYNESILDIVNKKNLCYTHGEILMNAWDLNPDMTHEEELDTLELIIKCAINRFEYIQTEFGPFVKDEDENIEDILKGAKIIKVSPQSEAFKNMTNFIEKLLKDKESGEQEDNKIAENQIFLDNDSNWNNKVDDFKDFENWLLHTHFVNSAGDIFSIEKLNEPFITIKSLNQGFTSSVHINKIGNLKAIRPGTSLKD